MQIILLSFPDTVKEEMLKLVNECRALFMFLSDGSMNWEKTCYLCSEFLFSYLILWVSFRESASLRHHSPYKTQYETLT